jgi:hypothetical protein
MQALEALRDGAGETEAGLTPASGARSIVHGEVRRFTGSLIRGLIVAGLLVRDASPAKCT